MPRTEARIHVKVWANRDFTALQALSQWTYTALLTQPDISLAGVVTYNPRRVANLAQGITGQQLDDALADLEAGRFIVYDPDTCEVWIRTFAKYDGVLKNRNLRAGMWTAFLGIQSPHIRKKFCDQYADHVDEAIEEGWIDEADLPQEGGSAPPRKAVPDPQEGGSAPPNNRLPEPEEDSGTSDSSSSPPPRHLRGTRTHANGETNPNGTPRTWDQDWRQVSAAVRAGSNRPLPENITGRARAAVQRLGGMRQLGSLDPKSAKFDFRDAWKEVGNEQTV